MSNEYCQLHETTETLSSIWSPLSPLLLVSLVILMNKEMLFIKLDSKLIFQSSRMLFWRNWGMAVMLLTIHLLRLSATIRIWNWLFREKESSILFNPSSSPRNLNGYLLILHFLRSLPITTSTTLQSSIAVSFKEDVSLNSFVCFSLKLPHISSTLFLSKAVSSTLPLAWEGF